MLGDFWGPYFVTIAAVTTTAIVGFVLRFVWRWWTAPLPSLVLLELMTRGVRVHNEGDCTIHVLAVEALPPPAETAWRFEYPTPRRVAPTRSTGFNFGNVPALRVDRAYRVVLRDDHRVRWEATYDPAAGREEHTLTNPQLRRLWPRPLAWLALQ